MMTRKNCGGMDQKLSLSGTSANVLMQQIQQHKGVDLEGASPLRRYLWQRRADRTSLPQIRAYPRVAIAYAIRAAHPDRHYTG